MKDKILFIPQTPYHIFLTIYYGILNQEYLNHVLIYSGFSEANHYCDILKDCGLFENVIYKNNGPSKMRDRLFIEKSNSLILQQYIVNNGIKKLYIFTDVIPSIDALLKYYVKEIEIVNIEEGIAYYYNQKRPQSVKSKMKEMICKFLFGINYNINYNYGTSSYINSCHLFYPDCSKSSIVSKKKYIPYQRETETEKIIRDRFFKYYNVNIPYKIDYLFCLPLSTFVGYNYWITYLADIVADIRTKKLEDKYNIVFKYHPYEKKDYLNLKNRYFIINQNIPLEFIYRSEFFYIANIFGTISTSLYTARFFCKERPNIFYFPDQNIDLDIFFKKLNINKIDANSRIF